MSAGAGIIWSTLILLLALGIWRATVNKKWKTVGKVLAAIVGVAILVGVVIWGWSSFQDRPQVTSGLKGIMLGMSPTDVTLALGKPQQTRLPTKQARLGYVYRDEYDKSYWLLVAFDGVEEDYRVGTICENEGSSRLFGLGRFTSEKELVDRLGKWPKRSVYGSGLRQIVSYPQWQVSYILEKGEVVGLCVSADGDVTYTDDSPSLRPWEKFDPTTAKPVQKSTDP